MRLSKKSALIFILLTASCSSQPKDLGLDVDLCAVLMRDGAPICRCTKPDGEMYSLTIRECADQKYYALSPDDAALVFETLFQLKIEANSCLEAE